MGLRLRDWQSRLSACRAEHCDRPFAWGSQDCALWGADCVRAVTGEDPAADLRGTYTDAAGAARIIARLGGLRAIADARLGARIVAAVAQPGDIGLVLSGGRECFSVCFGEVWVAPSVDGLENLQLDSVLLAWRCTRDSNE